MSCQKYIILFLCVNVLIFTNGETSGEKTIVTSPHINTKINNLSNIATEGGKITVNNTIIHTGNNDTQPVQNASIVSLKINNNKLDLTHGREGVTKPAISTTTVKPVVKITNTSVTLPKTTTEKTIPVVETEVNNITKPIELHLNVTKNASSTVSKTVVEPVGDSKIVPRKGAPVDLPELLPSATSSSTTTTTTSTTTTTKLTTQKPKKMKPTVTVGSDDEPYPPSNFVPHKKLDNSSELKHSYVGNKYFKKGPDYVLPIVLTILAVPLVAIILTVLYKRGSEWWQHRHYRRMDFLIDGMYNN